MKPPKVSVLIPTYNYARYLPEAIQSVLAQDFSDFELFLSDDASTDNSREVIEHYTARDPRIRHRLHEERLGMVANWNYCLQEARGDYIKFVFGDDLLASPLALGRLAGLLDSSAGISVAVSARRIIDEHSHVLMVRGELGAAGRHDGHDVIRRCLEANANLIGEPSVVMFRKSQAGCGFDASYRQLPDLEMWFRLLEQGDAAYSPEALCAFRQHGAQQTVVNQPQNWDQKEQRLLLGKLFTHPWLCESASRRLLFTQLYALRKTRSDNGSDGDLDQKISAALGPGWFKLYWLRHKLTKPAKNLRRFLRQRLARNGNP